MLTGGRQTSDASARPGAAIERRRMALLLRHLSFHASTDIPHAATLPSAQDEADLIAAGLQSGLLPALVEHARRNLPPAVGGHGEGTTLLDGRLGNLLEGFRYRRRLQRTRLDEAVAALNAASIAPLLIAGARAIWLDEMPWRVVGDLPLLIPRREFATANGILADRLGYRPVRALDRSGYRRETCWFHPAMSGCVVVREIGSNRELERLLSADELDPAASIAAHGNARARVLPPHTEIACTLLHEHVACRARPVCVGLVELYAFAVASRCLSDEQHAAFHDLSRRSAQRLAVVTAWQDTAERVLQMPPRPPFRLAAAHGEAAQTSAQRVDAVAPVGCCDCLGYRVRLIGCDRRRWWQLGKPTLLAHALSGLLARLPWRRPTAGKRAADTAAGSEPR